MGAGPACRRDDGLTPAKGEEDARVSESTTASGEFHPGHRDIREAVSTGERPSTPGRGLGQDSPCSAAAWEKPTV